MSLGERIRTARLAAGFSQVKLAAEIGVAQTTLSAWESGKNEPSREDIRRLAQVLGIDASQIEALNNDGASTRTIDVMGYVGAGQLIEPIGDSDAIDHIIAPPMAPLNAQAFIVRGHSMQPAYRDGNVIICWSWYDDPRPILGMPAIVKLSDGQMALKTIELGSRPGLFTLVSLNQMFPPMRDVQIAGAAPVEITLRRANWI